MTATTPNTNKIGLLKDDYKGSKSTLCTGCGHDSITSNIISAFFLAGIDPYEVGKMSGIGCSSKTPAYFLSKSSGFNSVHGRMSPVSTGAKLGNRSLKLIGISGDGDTGSIGIGGFIHMVRRNLPICYIVANNGVYGLTKGQFSATSERGAKLKTGDSNLYEQIDICTLALEMGCTFVARSFSGDTKQLVTLITAAMKHPGTAVIDVISPCVTFNNQPDSTKSYDYIKEHRISLHELGIVETNEEIKVDYQEGTTQDVELPDGTFLRLKKVDSRNHNVTDRTEAFSILRNAREKKELLTGLFYINKSTDNLLTSLSLCSKPLAQLNEQDCRPSKEVFSSILNQFR